jgi:hypothetical protein
VPHLFTVWWYAWNQIDNECWKLPQLLQIFASESRNLYINSDIFVKDDRTDTDLSLDVDKIWGLFDWKELDLGLFCVMSREAIRTLWNSFSHPNPSNDFLTTLLQEKLLQHNLDHLLLSAMSVIEHIFPSNHMVLQWRGWGEFLRNVSEWWCFHFLSFIYGTMLYCPRTAA